ncbi:MAG: cation:proton antiporter [Dehalococcoidia bacterium]|nr:cation:proton antiporter [Dehalococcoidia bacterium]
MPESSFAVNFFAAVVAALLMGYVAHRLHLPPMVGYLLAGVVVGPHTPGFRSDEDLIRSLAEVGVSFLLFAVGTEVHLSRLRRFQRVGLLGGTLQVVLTIGLGALIGRSVGSEWTAAFFFGSLVAVSSTTVALKLLLDKGQLDTLHGRISLAILLMQDLLVVPLMLVLSVLATPSDSTPLTILLALAKVMALLTAGLVVGPRLIPHLLDRIASTGSQELFLFAAISIALGGAIGTQLLGVSAAVGAFLAGMAVSQGKFSQQIETMFAPFRDLFSIFFFISVGMLLDPSILSKQLLAASGTILLVVAGKFVLVALVAKVFGYGRRVSVLVGVYLAQVGELSFILAGIGLGQGIIDARLYTLLITGALVSIFASPFLVQLGPQAFDWASRRRVFSRLLADASADHD